MTHIHIPLPSNAGLVKLCFVLSFQVPLGTIIKEDDTIIADLENEGDQVSTGDRVGALNFGSDRGGRTVNQN